MRARFVLVLVGLARAVSAQPRPPAALTKEFQAGVDAFRLGKLDEARAHLEKARALDPRLPGPFRFLAAVSKAQGKFDECVDDARQALVLNPRSSEALETRKLHDECRVSAGRQPYRGPELTDGAAIAVTSNTQGATVKIGGLAYGGTPMAPRPIAAGKLEIDVEKRGWKTAHVEIDAPQGIVTDVDAELEPDLSAETSAERGAQGVGLGAAAPAEKPTKGWLVLPGERVEMEPGTHVIERRRDGADVWRRRVRIRAGEDTTVTPVFTSTEAREGRVRAGLYTLAAGGALLATGFAFALASEHANDDAYEIVRIETARDPSNPGAAGPVHTRADLQAAIDRANRDATISDVAYGAGAVAVGVAAYFLYRGARDRDDAPPPYAIAPVHGGGVITRQVRW